MLGVSLTPAFGDAIYSITYHTNGGVVSGDGINEETSNTTYTQQYDGVNDVTLPTPTRDGYVFTGWCPQEVITDGVNCPVDVITQIASGTSSNIDLYATWVAGYAINYIDVDTNTNPPFYEVGQSVTLNNPTREGYVFMGWCPYNSSDTSTNCNFNERIDGDWFTTQTGDKWLRAMWAEDISKTCGSSRNAIFSVQINGTVTSRCESCNTSVFSCPSSSKTYKLSEAILLSDRYDLRSFFAGEKTPICSQGYIMRADSDAGCVAEDSITCPEGSYANFGYLTNGHFLTFDCVRCPAGYICDGGTYSYDDATDIAANNFGTGATMCSGDNEYSYSGATSCEICERDNLHANATHTGCECIDEDKINYYTWQNNREIAACVSKDSATVGPGRYVRFYDGGWTRYMCDEDYFCPGGTYARDMADPDGYAGRFSCGDNLHSNYGASSQDDCTICPASDNWGWQSPVPKNFDGVENSSPTRCVQPFWSPDFSTDDGELEFYRCYYRGLLADYTQQEIMEFFGNNEEEYNYYYNQPCNPSAFNAGIMLCRYDATTQDYTDCSAMAPLDKESDYTVLFHQELQSGNLVAKSNEAIDLALEKTCTNQDDVDWNSYFGVNDYNSITQYSDIIMHSGICEASTYSITYHTNGGVIANMTASTPNAEYTKEYNSAYITNLPTPTRAGYIFKGWCPQEVIADGVTCPVDVITQIAFGTDIDLYATWVAGYAINYVDEYNSVGNPNVYTPVEPVVLNNPTRDGYVFMGWCPYNSSDTSTNCNFNERIDGDWFATQTGEKWLRAMWAEDATQSCGAGKWAGFSVFADGHVEGFCSTCFENGDGYTCPTTSATYKLSEAVKIGLLDSEMTGYGEDVYAYAGGLTITCPDDQILNTSSGQCVSKNAIKCDAGSYINAPSDFTSIGPWYSYECSSCPAGYACDGKTYSYDDMIINEDYIAVAGLVKCTGNTYSGSGASSCKICDSDSGGVINEEHTTCTCGNDKFLADDGKCYLKDSADNIKPGYEVIFTSTGWFTAICNEDYYCPGNIGGNPYTRAEADEYNFAGRISCGANKYSNFGSSSVNDCTVCPHYTAENIDFWSFGELSKGPTRTIESCIVPIVYAGGEDNIDKLWNCAYKFVYSEDELIDLMGNSYYEYGYNQPCDVSSLGAVAMVCHYNTNTGGYTDCSKAGAFDKIEDFVWAGTADKKYSDGAGAGADTAAANDLLDLVMDKSCVNQSSIDWDNIDWNYANDNYFNANDMANITQISDLVMQTEICESSAYSIIYHTNGGVVAGATENVENQQYVQEYSDEMTLPTPTRDGYVFAGWCDSNVVACYGNEVTQITTPDDNVDLYATWIQDDEILCQAGEMAKFYINKQNNTVEDKSCGMCLSGYYCPDKKLHKLSDGIREGLINNNVYYIISGQIQCEDGKYSYKDGSVECSLCPVNSVVTDNHGLCKCNEDNQIFDVENNACITSITPDAGRYVWIDTVTLKINDVDANVTYVENGSYACDPGYYCPGDTTYTTDNVDENGFGGRLLCGNNRTSPVGSRLETQCKACPSETEHGIGENGQIDEYANYRGYKFHYRDVYYPCKCEEGSTWDDAFAKCGYDCPVSAMDIIQYGTTGVIKNIHRTSYYNTTENKWDCLGIFAIIQDASELNNDDIYNPQKMFDAGTSFTICKQDENADLTGNNPINYTGPCSEPLTICDVETYIDVQAKYQNDEIVDYLQSVLGEDSYDDLFNVSTRVISPENYEANADNFQFNDEICPFIPGFCGEGKYLIEDKVGTVKQCKACPAGHWCPGVEWTDPDEPFVSGKNACASGTYNSLEKQKSEDACLSCALTGYPLTDNVGTDSALDCYKACSGTPQCMKNIATGEGYEDNCSYKSEKAYYGDHCETQFDSCKVGYDKKSVYEWASIEFENETYRTERCNKSLSGNGDTDCNDLQNGQIKWNWTGENEAPMNNMFGEVSCNTVPGDTENRINSEVKFGKELTGTHCWWRFSKFDNAEINQPWVYDQEYDTPAECASKCGLPWENMDVVTSKMYEAMEANIVNVCDAKTIYLDWGGVDSNSYGKAGTCKYNGNLNVPNKPIQESGKQFIGWRIQINDSTETETESEE